MTSGGWHSQEQRHGRHRQGATGAAWTPAVRPTDATPAHARHDGLSAFRSAGLAPPPAWPTSAPARPVSARQPAWPTSDVPSEVLTRRPGWPVDPEVPKARATAAAPAWPAPRHRAADLGVPRVPLSRKPAQAPPSFLREPIVGQDVPERHRPRHSADEPDMLADTVPMGGRARHSKAEPADGESCVVAYALPETPESGLRKFDLGTVPASVTPPRTWRKAAWFAVGTSAAVVLGLTVATTELMGRPVNDGALIDALPAYPTGPLTLGELPHESTTSDGPSTGRPSKSSDRPSASDAAPPSSSSPSSQDSPPRDTVTGSTTGEESVAPTEPPGEDPTTTQPTSSGAPSRQTVGPAPVTPTDPAKMGDRTEEYFELVTSDAAAAHAMTTGGMAREGAEGIEARYGGIDRVEIQEITIDRNKAITTSKVKVVHKDGTETVEHRQLTFTWGGDPKITDETVTG